MRLELHLTPIEWHGLYQFAKGYIVSINSHINAMVLSEWAANTTPNVLWKWHCRPPHKAYKVAIPYSVAVAFWQEAQINRIANHTQMALASIDSLLKNEGLKRTH